MKTSVSPGRQELSCYQNVVTHENYLKNIVISMRDDKQLITCVRNLLLPAPPPFIQWLERVLRLLPSRFYPVTLLPVADVKPVNAVNGDYHATGNHPVFQIVDESHLSDAGWYLLEAVVVRHGGTEVFIFSC